MSDNRKINEDTLHFIYERYQSRVDQLENWSLKITTGVLAIAAGAFLVSAQTFGKTGAEVGILDVIYDINNVIFISPLFIYATVYSLWTRRRVLHAVSRLVAIERRLGISEDGLDYWKSTRRRARFFILTSPWPWIWILFSLGPFLLTLSLSLTVKWYWGWSVIPVLLVLSYILRRYFNELIDAVSSGS